MKHSLWVEAEDKDGGGPVWLILPGDEGVILFPCPVHFRSPTGASCVALTSNNIASLLNGL